MIDDVAVEVTEEPTVPVKVVFFAKARELVNCDYKRLKLPKNSTYENIKKLLFQQHFPTLEVISSACILAVDHRYIKEDENITLCPSSEIAIIPPLSGG